MIRLLPLVALLGCTPSPTDTADTGAPDTADTAEVDTGAADSDTDLVDTDTDTDTDVADTDTGDTDTDTADTAEVDTGAADSDTDLVDTDTDTDVADTDTDTGGTDTDAVDTDTDTDTADTDTDVPPLPVASRCLVSTDTPGQCAGGVTAEDWSGARYEWVLVDFQTSKIVRKDASGDVDVATIETTVSWHTTGGLAVLPDGDVVFSGAALPYSDLVVDGATTVLGTDYVRFVARISPTGTVRWVRTVVGISAEKVLLFPRADGTVLFVGDYFQKTDFDAASVDWQYFWDAVVVAALDEDGSWLWATTHTKVPASYSRVKLLDAVGTADGGVAVDLTFTQSLATDAGTETCAATAPCPAVATIDAAGAWTSLTLK